MDCKLIFVVTFFMKRLSKCVTSLLKTETNLRAKNLLLRKMCDFDFHIDKSNSRVYVGAQQKPLKCASKETVD